jgi:hypothetical protein
MTINTVILVTADAASEAIASHLQTAIQAVNPGVTVTQQAAALGYPTATDATLICPLSLDLPAAAPQQWTQWQDLAAQRAWVESLDYATGDGDLWLPVMWTAKGPLYGEAIHRTPNAPYPHHLNDAQRQPLYALAYQLLSHYQAMPAVYLVGFRVVGEEEIQFDRVLPFPNGAAIASLGRQTPDLLTCHWLCLSGQPLRDVTVLPDAIA